MRADQATETADVVVPVGAVAVAVVAALVVAAIVSAVVRTVARRSSLALDLLKRARRPMQVSVVIVAVWIALRVSTEQASWRVNTEHVLLIALIVALAWLAGALAFVAEDAALARYRVDIADNRHARRVRTQITVLRRLTVAVLALCALAGVLMTFPGARAAGASLFASAGVLSVVAGLAAQSTLANVFAGLQLAFTDAIRVDDVVVVEGEWGRIEEITMTYIVVHLWDDRRLILPSTYFTTTPFQNWTRSSAQLLGTVEMDLDWSVPVDAMRRELTELLEDTDLWDHRVGILQVTEATGGYVRVRALASATDAPTLFDLRCYVREGLVDWLQRTQPGALPRTRFEGAGVLTGDAGGRPALPTWPDARRDGSAAGADDRTSGAGRPGDVDGAAHVPVVVPTAERPAEDDQPEDGAAHVPVVVDPARAHPSEDDDDHREDAMTPGWAGATVPVRRSVRWTGRPEGADGEGPDGEDAAAVTRVGRRDEGRLFTGSLGALARAQAFSGPGEDVFHERERIAERDAPPPDPVRDDVARTTAYPLPVERRVPREDGGDADGGDGGAGAGPGGGDGP
ncbi:mechanosensitive ion channel domain-containing protein [uncultured Cellulomonas sp.]|uniref:mechanosensitive ion channel domain-containing protein n=1 Tax=uncultured Cellulomonas sp. TaxID=189682 RepID=UPI00260C033C|nr:mechanosensitive ion channel domain-containing protein [uncultured Cellulomonas sp.]